MAFQKNQLLSFFLLFLLLVGSTTAEKFGHLRNKNVQSDAGSSIQEQQRTLSTASSYRFRTYSRSYTVQTGCTTQQQKRCIRFLGIGHCISLPSVEVCTGSSQATDFVCIHISATNTVGFPSSLSHDGNTFQQSGAIQTSTNGCPDEPYLYCQNYLEQISISGSSFALYQCASAIAAP